MNLSEDEINALLTGDSQDEAPAEDESADIMSPDAIAAMLNDGAGTDAVPEAGADDIMSPEAVAAMLDDTPAADAAAEPAAEAAPAEPAADAASDELDALLAGESAPAPAASAAPEEIVLVSKEGMLKPDEVDILGEVGNISMGAVATTMYSLLDRRVSITTPRVSVYDTKEVLTVYKIPFVVATIEYVEGISGTNLLVLKVDDAALITDLLMGGDGKIEGAVELNEMHLSAMSEIMNQMMGASSTSLSKLLRTPVNISPPKSTQVDVGFDVSDFLGDEEMVTKISFDMEIEGLLKSELIQIMPYEASRAFAKRFMDAGMGVPSSDGDAAEAPPAAAAPPAPAPTPAPPPPAPAPAPAPQPPAAAPFPPAYPADPYQQAPYPQMPYPPMYPQPGAASGRLVDVHPMQFQSFDSHSPVGEQSGMDLVYNIPLQVTVELGKTKKEISEILEFGAGTIVVLDKIAGDPVEIVVNGKLIARGEVVVIDDNYGVRITDIING